MNLNFFNKLEHINWTKMWWIVGIITTFWLGLATIVPEPWFRVISVLLAAVQSALLFATRGTKYVENRLDPPTDGKP